MHIAYQCTKRYSSLYPGHYTSACGHTRQRSTGWHAGRSPPNNTTEGLKVTSATKKTIATRDTNKSSLIWGMAVFGASGLTAWIAMVGLDSGQDLTRSAPWITAHVSTILYAMLAKERKGRTVVVSLMAGVSTVLCALYAFDQFRTLF